MDCKECKARFRADNLIEAHSKGKVNPDTMTNEEMEAYIAEHKVACPNCGKHNWTPIRTFNLMFETSRGVTDESQNKIYLRPETAQGEFVNFLKRPAHDARQSAHRHRADRQGVPQRDHARQLHLPHHRI